MGPTPRYAVVIVIALCFLITALYGKSQTIAAKKPPRGRVAGKVTIKRQGCPGHCCGLTFE
jgi:hypothetical protein